MYTSAAQDSKECGTSWVQHRFQDEIGGQMADVDSSKSDGISNSVSLVISILAMLISAGGLYWQFLRGPKEHA